MKFFNDPTWFWNNPTHISPLTEEDLKEFKQGKIREAEEPSLQTAYQLASEYEGLEQFLRDEGILKDNEQYTPYESWQDEKEKVTIPNLKKSSRKSSSVNHDSEDDSDDTPRKKKSKQSSSSAAKNFPSSTSNSKKAKEPTFEELSQKAVTFRSKLQRGLIQRTTPPTEDELTKINQDFKALEKFSDTINLDLLRLSKLHKVLKAITRVDSLQRPDDFKFHERSISLLLKWEDLITDLKNEKIDKNGHGARTDTPNSSTLAALDGTPKKENDEEPENIEHTEESKKEDGNLVKDEDVKEEETKSEAVSNNEAGKEKTAKAEVDKVVEEHKASETTTERNNGDSSDVPVKSEE